MKQGTQTNADEEKSSFCSNYNMFTNPYWPLEQLSEALLVTDWFQGKRQIILEVLDAAYVHLKGIPQPEGTLFLPTIELPISLSYSYLSFFWQDTHMCAMLIVHCPSQ